MINVISWMDLLLITEHLLFGENSRFSPYYSIGGGWLMNNESFIQNNLPFINELRLRYSFGVVGNSSLSLKIIWRVFNRNPQDLYLGGILLDIEWFCVIRT